MSLNRFATRRDANELSIAAEAAKLGWWLTPLDTPCDYLGWHAYAQGGGWFPIEIKRPDGPRGGQSRNKLTKAQTAFHGEAYQRGARVLVWKTLHDMCEDTAPGRKL